MAVFVLDKHKTPLMPCSEKRARLLLALGRAVVARRYPFTIRLKDRIGGDTQPLKLKIDPGAKQTGIAITRVDEQEGEHVLHLAEITHRGDAIRAKLEKRAGYRRGRRSRNLRYRAPRFDNRTRPEGWLPPSIQSRVDNVIALNVRYRRLAPMMAVAVEQVRFDMQVLENPEISGVEYQEGTLHGYEVREYLLEKWGRRCVYCTRDDRPLQIDHIHPRSKGGSDRVSNLTLACESCNQAKGNRPVEQFLAKKPEVLERVLKQAKKSLAAAAAVNAARNVLLKMLQATGLPVEASTGGRTKFNRARFGVPKSHANDAACVGQTETLHGWSVPVLVIKAHGRGAYQRTRTSASGFPRGYLMKAKTVFGFQTGDLVQANVPFGKNAGTQVGRVAIRATGLFNIQTTSGVVQGVHHRHCRIVHRADGHSYSQQVRLLPMLEDRAILLGEF